MDVSIVVSLLPLFFLLHELEEIIMVRSWLDKNQAALRERFSNLGHIIVWMEQMTTRRFIVVAAEEFIIVSLCTLMCLYFGKIVVWYCCLAAFAIHLLYSSLCGKDIFLPSLQQRFVCHIVFGQ